MSAQQSDEKGTWPAQDLPSSWIWASFELVFENKTSSNRKLKQKQYLAKGPIPVVDQGQILVGGYTDEESLKYDGELPVIIFGDHTRCAKYVNFSFVQGADGVKVLKPTALLDPNFSYKSLMALSLPDKGYSRHFKFLKATFFPVPPFNEQKRIADKIEALQTKSNKAKKALETAKPLLGKLRQSILAAAFRGDLTADWRKKNPDVEPASILLERIRKERRKRWEETELAKMKAKGKEPKNDKWKDRYKEPEPVDTTDLPELPEGWCWSSIEELSSLIQYGSSTKTTEDASSIPVLRMGNIVNGKLSYDNLRYLPGNNKDFPNLLLADGDLLFNRTNSPELVGKSAIFEDIEKPCSFASYLIRVRIIQMKSSLVAGYINSPFGRKWIDSVVNQQVGQANVNGTKLKALGIPIPPIEEQKVLEKKIKEALSHSESIFQKIDSTITMIEKQNQSILAKAFRGELVPQDPTDEPASVLLDRIKAEREAMKPKKKTTRKRKTTTTS